MLNKDFLKQVLAGEKQLLELSQVRFRYIPAYDELSLKRFYPFIQDDPVMFRFFPTKLPQGRLPDRDYFWNVFNTLNEPYVT